MVVCSIGEIIWDVFPDQERLGGAPLNFIVNMHRLGDHAILLSAVGTDVRGDKALDQIYELGLATGGIRKVPELPTGTAQITQNDSGEPSFTIPRPAAFDAIALDVMTMTKLQTAPPDWIYFGTLLHMRPEMELLTVGLTERFPGSRVFYDMNLRPGQWNLQLVQRLSRMATVLKLNEAEAETLFVQANMNGEFTVEIFCGLWAAEYSIEVICVTLGPAGCLIYSHGEVCRAPGIPVKVCDTVGSGDAFAAGFLHSYAAGQSIANAARFANSLGALITSRAGATPDWTIDELPHANTGT